LEIGLRRDGITLGFGNGYGYSLTDWELAELSYLNILLLSFRGSAGSLRPMPSVIVTREFCSLLALPGLEFWRLLFLLCIDSTYGYVAGSPALHLHRS
jgi:hypothetical protein